MNDLLLKQLHLICVLEHSGQVDLVLSLYLVEADVVELHLVLLPQALLATIAFLLDSIRLEN